MDQVGLCFKSYYAWQFLYNVLTAADVRCAVANTRRKANWRMCCMVSEESHCSGEMQYTLNLSVGNIDINTYWSSLTSFYWESGSVVCSWVSLQWEWPNVFRCTCFSRQELLVSYPEWCCFYTHFYSLVNIFPPLAGTLIWCPFNVFALIK